MKSLTKILFAAFLFVGLNSAFADTQDRHLTGFHAISLSGAYDVYITQGSSESVKIDAPSNLLKHIITEVDGDVLKIRNKTEVFSWNNMFSNKKVVIHITVRDIHSINISGSSDVFFKEGIRAGQMELKVTGSGDIQGLLNAKNLQCSIAGSGDIKLSGNVETATVSVTGSGDFMARNLVTAATMIRVSGSGDAEVNANVKLDAHVSGSGDIRYAGTANQVSTSSSGSGDIHRIK